MHLRKGILHEDEERPANAPSLAMGPQRTCRAGKLVASGPRRRVTTWIEKISRVKSVRLFAHHVGNCNELPQHLARRLTREP